MTMTQAIRGVYGPMTPRPGAEDSMWSAIDRELGGKARDVRIQIRRRKHSRARLLLAAAAVLTLVLVSVFFLRNRFAEPEGPQLLTEAPTPSPTPEASPEPTPTVLKETRQIALVNAQVNDSPVLSVTDEGLFLARAVLPEGMTVDHWELNGEPVDAGERRFSLEFSSEGVKSVEAVLREEKHVTCVNAYLQFLDEDGNPAGWMYEDVCFEYDYTVPTTGEEHPGGSITARVTALNPSDEELDYWIIDGEKVEAETPAESILLENWDRSIRIEAVMRHGHRKRDLGPELVLSGTAPEDMGARPTDDLPAELRAVPMNAVVEVDYERDGVPFDPSAPARDGHIHDWVLDNTRTYQGTCCDPGPYTMVCSICGREYVSRTYYGEHEYQWENILLNSYDGGGVHAYSCIHCGDVRSMGNHQWTRADTTSNKMVCSVCGAVWYRQLPHGN